MRSHPDRDFAFGERLVPLVATEENLTGAAEKWWGGYLVWCEDFQGLSKISTVQGGGLSGCLRAGRNNSLD